MSYLSHLDCPECARVYSADELHAVCPDCGSPLLTRYDLPQARARLDRDTMTVCSTGMWRWRELLPVRDVAHIVTLGEGNIPLLHARANCWV